MRRKSYPASFKCDAIKYSDKFGCSVAATFFEVDIRMLKKWRADRERLKNMTPTKRASRYRKASLPDMEEELYQWVLERRKKNRAVLLKDIRQKAIQIAREGDQETFIASARWCQGFLRRKNLSLRRSTSVGQPVPNDWQERCRSFRRFVQKESMNVTSKNLVNIDEVPVPFDVVYSRTIDGRGKDSVKIDSTGHEKTNFTVLLGVTASGWMTGDLMKDWIEECWPNRDNDPSKCLLLMDSARAHLTDDVRDFFKERTKVAIIPGGMTRFLQPLDVGINKPFKDNLRRGWDAWMANEENVKFTKSGRRKRMSYAEAATLVSESFKAVTEETILHSFEKALNEEDMLNDLNTNFNSFDIDVQENMEVV